MWDVSVCVVGAFHLKTAAVGASSKMLTLWQGIFSTPCKHLMRKSIHFFYLTEPVFCFKVCFLFQCLPSEIEVKYKMAECYTMLKQDKDAIAILDGIPSRQRTPKVSSDRRLSQALVKGRPIVQLSVNKVDCSVVFPLLASHGNLINCDCPNWVSVLIRH